jgi:hypothetical protein
VLLSIYRTCLKFVFHDDRDLSWLRLETGWMLVVDVVGGGGGRCGSGGVDGGGSSWLIIFPYIWELNCKDEAQTSIHV